MRIEYIIIILAFFLVVLFIYGLIREKESAKKIRVLAKSVGEINRQMYESEIRFNDKIKELRSLKGGSINADTEALIDTIINEKLLHLNENMSVLKQNMQAFGEEFASRIVRIENNLKEASLSRANVAGADDRRILDLFGEGKSIEAIAKQLRISTPEVEFALKLANLR